MRPLDPALLKACAPARHWIAVTAAFTIGRTACTVGAAFAMAHTITHVVAAPHQGPPHGPLAATIGCLLIRALLSAAHDWAGERSATTVISSLRTAGLTAALHRRYAGPDASAVPAAALTAELDHLRAYVCQFLPQLIATCVVTPALITLTCIVDLTTGILQLFLVPLVPLFMALVGWATQSASARRLEVLERLTGQLRDLFAGLTTLRSVRRAADQHRHVVAASDSYRQATDRVLRMAFLSSFVLELLTTLAVAVIAVEVGLRLMHGYLAFTPALIVLIVAPEVFLPLRVVGQHFHASADGAAAARAALDVAKLPARPAGGEATTATPITAIRWSHISVRHSADVTAPHQVFGTAQAGQITALVGPSGAGKSTLIAVLLGLLTPTCGTVTVTSGTGNDTTSTDVEALHQRTWHQHLAWVPQAPSITPGTLADNIRAGREASTAPEHLVQEAACHAGLQGFVKTLPHGLNTPVGRDGVGVSAGQRHRIALARALLGVELGATVVMMDEPTAHVDPDTERLILATLRRTATAGAVVLVATHHEETIAAADRVHNVHSVAHPVSAGGPQ